MRLIEKLGICLVFPIKNAADPPSLWNALYPGEEMIWEWDEDGDARVAELWHLRMRLAESREVVYAKWLRGRATFFSRDVYREMLGRMDLLEKLRAPLSREAAALLELLEENSPQSTKSLRAQMDFGGKLGERIYQRALGDLWKQMRIVGTGEMDDGAFPSLMVGATNLVFEDLWEDRTQLNPKGKAGLEKAIAVSPLVAKALARFLAPKKV
ncbi:MAG: hypothetical protein ABI183_25325 [Polyangiaceae bacterium]